MKLLISGASGLIGGGLLRARALLGDHLRLLTRTPDAFEAQLRAQAPGHDAQVVPWNGLRVPETALDDIDAIVHLAGEPLFGGLPTRQRLTRLRSSRVTSTQQLVAALAARAPQQRPATLVCASAVGYYGDRGDEELDEHAAAGAGWSAELCADWEAAAAGAREIGMRAVSIRYGVVLARGGGFLARVSPLFRFGLGGRLGSGTQFFPWIHLDDAVALTALALDDPGIDGAVNAVAPEPVRNQTLTSELGRALNRPTHFAMPAALIRATLGPLATELLGSRRCHPKRAEAADFRWRFPTLKAALEQELG